MIALLYDEEAMLDQIHCFGGGSFALSNAPQIYINPNRYVPQPESPADIILITQANYDHCSPAILRRISDSSTAIVANVATDDSLGDRQAMVLLPWQSVTLSDVRITAVPPHPAMTSVSFGGHAPPVGYKITIGYYDIFYAGGMMMLPDSAVLKPDVAILPVTDPETGLATTNWIIDAVQRLQPRWVVPSHYSTSSGWLDLQSFKVALHGRAEVILPAHVG